MDGKLVLTLGDSIRLALSNNTDIRLDHAQIEFAQDNLRRVRGPFDPVATSSFADNRGKAPTITADQARRYWKRLRRRRRLGILTFPDGNEFSDFAFGEQAINERFAEFAESFAGQQFAIHDDRSRC